jgi:AcrR family transcriptional regulator
MTKKTFDVEAWIKIGLKTLKDEGLGKFSVESVASKAGVTKGSFYWHFKDRDEYFTRIVDYWLAIQHRIVEDFTNQPPGDPKQQLWDVMYYILTKNANDDVAMRSWVKHYDYATKAVKQVDKMRLNYLETLFCKMGLNKDNAKLRAYMLYFYQVGEHTLLVREKESVRVRLNNLHYQMLIADVP